jgi:hypothetical protein
MSFEKYRAEVDELKRKFGEAAAGSDVSVVVAACMEGVLSEIIQIENKADALKVASPLRQMVAHIESEVHKK